ncbi:hypothetical protein [Rhizobium sp. BR 362]
MLRTTTEKEWTPQMMSTLGIEVEALPDIWDADSSLKSSVA